MQELRCISRVVVHPRYRGLGLAVRLVRAALASAATPLTEAYAVMGRVHPFFEKAGMVGYPQPRRDCDARLVAALQSLGFDTVDLARPDGADSAGRPALCQRINTLRAEQRQWLRQELDRWYRQAVDSKQTRSRDELVQWRAAQRRLLLQPVYYLHDNRQRSKNAQEASAAARGLAAAGFVPAPKAARSEVSGVR
jgi:hypothetical protein